MNNNLLQTVTKTTSDGDLIATSD